MYTNKAPTGSVSTRNIQALITTSMYRFINIFIQHYGTQFIGKKKAITFSLPRYWHLYLQ